MVSAISCTRRLSGQRCARTDYDWWFRTEPKEAELVHQVAHWHSTASDRASNCGQDAPPVMSVASGSAACFSPLHQATQLMCPSHQSRPISVANHRPHDHSCRPARFSGVGRGLDRASARPAAGPDLFLPGELHLTTSGEPTPSSGPWIPESIPPQVTRFLL